MPIRKVDIFKEYTNKKDVPCFIEIKTRQIVEEDTVSFETISIIANVFDYAINGAVTHDIEKEMMRIYKNYARNSISPRFRDDDLVISFDYVMEKTYSVSAEYKFFNIKDYDACKSGIHEM